MNARLTATIALLAAALMVLSAACESTPTRPPPTPTSPPPTPTIPPPTPTSPPPTPTIPIPAPTDTPSVGGGNEEALERAQAELDKHRALWEAGRADDYSFVLEPICFCPQDLLDPVRITVVNGTVASAVYVDSGKAPEHDGFGRYVTIDALFDTIQEGIAENAAEVTVTYDPALGYPTDATIDYDARMADEEYRFIASGYAAE